MSAIISQMAGRNYKTGLLITGNSKGGVRAAKATRSELKKLNRTGKTYKHYLKG